MASIRNQILSEIHRRLRLVSGVSAVFRNPHVPPDPSTYPAISFFSLPDVLDNWDSDYGDSNDLLPDRPNLKRTWHIVIVPYMIGSDPKDDESAENEINEFLDDVERELYRDGITLGGLCAALVPGELGDLVKPYKGKAGIGIVTNYYIKYNRRLQDLY